MAIASQALGFGSGKGCGQAGRPPDTTICKRDLVVLLLTASLFQWQQQCMCWCIFFLPLLFSGYSHLLLDSNNVSVMFGSTPIDKTPRKGTDANYMDLGASVVCIYCTGLTVHGLHQAFRFIGKLLAMLCAFLTSDDFVRFNEIVRPKWWIY